MSGGDICTLFSFNDTSGLNYQNVRSVLNWEETWFEYQNDTMHYHRQQHVLIKGEDIKRRETRFRAPEARAREAKLDLGTTPVIIFSFM